MKVKCEVCKTEYSVPDMPSGRVRCALCGNVWVAKNPQKRSGISLFIASLCALLAALVFTVVFVKIWDKDNPDKHPLVSEVIDSSVIKDEDGRLGLVVNGVVKNQSDDIYGFPEIVIILHDAKGKLVAQQKFMPSATLLDVGQSVNFSHTIFGDIEGVKKISVELVNVEMGDKK